MNAKAHADTRKAIRRSLSGAGLPEPDALTGAVIEAFAEAGVFRLRGVIVGTIAFQACAGLLVEALAAKRRSDDLIAVLEEAASRGPAWRHRLETGAARLGDEARKIVQAILGTD